MFIVSVLHLFICGLLILIVLLQQGRGADAGVTFGGGGGTVFGAAGADTLLTKVTTILAICFMITSVILSASQNKWAATEGGLFTNVPEQAPASAPMANDPEAKQAAPATTNLPAQADPVENQAATQAPAANDAPKQAEVPAPAN